MNFCGPGRLAVYCWYVSFYDITKTKHQALFSLDVQLFLFLLLICSTFDLLFVSRTRGQVSAPRTAADAARLAAEAEVARLRAELQVSRGSSAKATPLCTAPTGGQGDNVEPGGVGAQDDDADMEEMLNTVHANVLGKSPLCGNDKW